MNSKNQSINVLLESHKINDWKKLQSEFSKEEIIEAILKHPGFEAKTRNYYSNFFNIPIKKIKSNNLIARLEIDPEIGTIQTIYEPYDC